MCGNVIFNVTYFATFLLRGMYNLKSMTFFEFISADALFFMGLVFSFRLFLFSPSPSVTSLLGFSVFYGSFRLFLWSSLHWSLPHVPTVPANALYTYLLCFIFLGIERNYKKKKEKALKERQASTRAGADPDAERASDCGLISGVCPAPGACLSLSRPCSHQLSTPPPAAPNSPLFEMLVGIQTLPHKGIFKHLTYFPKVLCASAPLFIKSLLWLAAGLRYPFKS